MSAEDMALLQLVFEAEVIPWWGPAPFFFVAVPDVYAAELRGGAKAVSYGWGVALTVEAVRR